MVIAKCKAREFDKSGKVANYVLVDKKGKTTKMSAAQLKEHILEEKIYVVNLTYTEDGRLLVREKDDTIISEGGCSIRSRSKRLRVDWVSLGEGYNGDYDPNDPEDASLLRFDVYFTPWGTDGWTELDGGSYCTQLTVDASPKEKARLLKIIFDAYACRMPAYLAGGGNGLKHIGERLSGIYEGYKEGANL